MHSQATGPRFTDRLDAGRQLAGPVAGLLTGPVTLVGLPRGGVVVAAALRDELAAAGMAAAVSFVAVAKVRETDRPELALGAVTADATFRSEGVCELTGTSTDRFAELTELARRHLADRTAALPPAPPVGDRALIVDDGLATGSTVAAAVAQLRADGAQWVGLAVPVADAAAWDRIRPQVDDGVALVQRRPLGSVSRDYRDFTQVGDAEVAAALAG